MHTYIGVGRSDHLSLLSSLVPCLWLVAGTIPRPLICQAVAPLGRRSLENPSNEKNKGNNRKDVRFV